MRDLAISISLLAITLGVYWRATSYDFISYDDDEYVTENVHVQQGLSLSSVRWAFTTRDAANYHPVTWLSHMLDWTLFGDRAGGHHFTSVLFHAINAVLVYLVLVRLTGAAWRSATVAALFALHPLHVESVAWVAERKDVLSTFFMLLAMLAYGRYARTRGSRWYVAVACLFAMGLLAKPMVITLPVILLLIDYWPLGRIMSRDDLRRVLIEKLPLFAFSVASGTVTILVQQAGGAVKSLERIDLWTRLANGVVSYVRYLGKMFVPVDLVVFYPMPGAWPAWQVGLAAVLVAGVTLVAARCRRRMPWVAMGWLWYVIMLLPVIGVIQVGDQAMADRYTYVPLIGVFVMIVWTIGEWVKRSTVASAVAGAAGAVVIAIFTIMTWCQLGHWRSSEALFRHAALVTYDNWLAYNHLATSLAQQKRYSEALDAAGLALKIHSSAVSHLNYGNVLLKMGRFEEAQEHYQRAISISPHDPRMRVARNNLAIALAQLRRPDEAEALLRETIKMYPEYPDAHANLGTVLLLQNRFDEAASAYRSALKLNPRHPQALGGLERLGMRPPSLPQ